MHLPFSPELFAILVCPDTHAALKFYKNQLVSCAAESRRAYPVEDGIPIMLIDKSVVLSREVWQTAMAAGLAPAASAGA